MAVLAYLSVGVLVGMVIGFVAGVLTARTFPSEPADQSAARFREWS